MKAAAQILYPGLASVFVLAGAATLALWVRSYYFRDCTTVRNSTEYIDRAKTVESIGGRIILSSDATRHLVETSSAGGYTISRQSQALTPGEAASRVQSNDRLIAIQGYGRWGFGSLKTSFVQKTRGNWDRLPSNDVVADDYKELVLPDWALMLATLVIPLAWLRTQVRGRRALVQATCCRACGYDLRATPDRCPECGTIPATSGGPIFHRR